MSNIFESVVFLNEGLFSSLFGSKKAREKNATRISREEFEKSKKDTNELKKKLNSALKSLNPKITDDKEFEEKVAASNTIYEADFEEISKKYEETANKYMYDYADDDYDKYIELTEKLGEEAHNDVKKLIDKISKILDSFAKSNGFSVENSGFGCYLYSDKYPYIKIELFNHEYSIRVMIEYKEMVIIE